MVILDEKCMIQPPPPYSNVPTVPPPFPGSPSHRSIATLPSHIFLKIVYLTFPQTAGFNEGHLERQRKILYWLSHNLRLVNRSFYIACMHVLRSIYLYTYGSLIRVPYTSDPLPLSSFPSPAGTVQATQRETQILDLFIALKVREDVMMDDTELHLEREESFKDLFDLMQPRSRLEDLVRDYGLREGVVYTNSPGVSRPQPNTSTGGSANKPAPLPFSMLSISFSPRKASLVLATTSRKRAILEVVRTRDEKLEVTAKKLVRQLKVWLSDA